MSFFAPSPNKFAMVDFEMNCVVMMIRQMSFFDMESIECLSNDYTLLPAFFEGVIIKVFFVLLPEVREGQLKNISKFCVDL